MRSRTSIFVVLESYAGFATTIPTFVRRPDVEVNTAVRNCLKYIRRTSRVRLKGIDSALQERLRHIIAVHEIEAQIRVQHLQKVISTKHVI